MRSTSFVLFIILLRIHCGSFANPIVADLNSVTRVALEPHVFLCAWKYYIVLRSTLKRKRMNSLNYSTVRKGEKIFGPSRVVAFCIGACVSFVRSRFRPKMISHSERGAGNKPYKLQEIALQNQIFIESM